MEKRKETVSALKMCRFCLSQDDPLSPIYEGTLRPNNAVHLPLKILSCLSIEAFPSDKMPTFICNRCSFFMDLTYEFKDICRRADERILHFVQNGSSLEPLNWPLTLTHVYRNSKKSDKHVVQAVVEGGATVQVTAQEVSYSEDEDDEENVYKIKIGDGSKEIEVVPSSKNSVEPEEKITPKPPKDDENRLTISKVNNYHDGCWACDECECTYPLQQLLELHKMQKHRTRNVSCDQCDAKFFTKYDLSVHTVRHSDEMPFQCVACDKKFKRLFHLKRHEKIVHSDIPQLACPHCPATFLSIEELTAHQKRHARVLQRSYKCDFCDKSFHERATLQRHVDLIHEKKPSFRCEYCPEQFTSASKLMRHVRSHAGERPYPCKYCDKTFLKSHHFTRHLRIKHRETIRKPRGSFGQSEFRCEQCDETFTTQDDLIYHSAIHATQNLICPLCQEKFENVDAVTAHIKSHVNGIEFMCDLCELVFTTKEKLDAHLTAAHADELENELGEDESSMDLDGDEFEDDNGINVKEEDGEMVVEIKKTDNFMLPESRVDTDEKPDNTQSEDSEAEPSYTELATVDTLAMVQKQEPLDIPEKVPETPKEVASSTTPVTPTKPVVKTENETASILRKAEEVKRKVQQTAADSNDTKDKTVSRVESSSSATGASDKSLRLLEKELQELKRTNNTRNEANKAPTRPMENLRNRRIQPYTSTPKTRATEERRTNALTKSQAEKKVAERRAVTKENKEPKETKDPKESKEQKEAKDSKEPKDVKDLREAKDKESKDSKEPKEPKDLKEAEGKQIVSNKEEKDKNIKDKETPKSLVKNGTSSKEDSVRRSTRPSKIKDYAKMIRDKSQVSSEEESDNDEEYKETEKQETRPRLRRGSLKPTPAKSPVVTPAASPVTPAAATPATPAPRKRGRPRKGQNKETPAKLKKEDDEAMDESVPDESEDAEDKPKRNTPSGEKESEPVNTTKGEVPKSPTVEPNSGVVVSPTGQTLKKVPIRALPPGIKPLPLPVSRPMGPGELCEMQIGKKVVKVQKIVMTKAEVEAMAKQGLVEMKDGTMVLKQGIKLPSSDTLKSSLAVDKDAAKSAESPSKVTASAPNTEQS